MFWEIISGNIPISNEKGDTSTSVFMLGTILGSSRHLKKEEEKKIRKHSFGKLYSTLSALHQYI